jgi:alpha,alpha-trehalose phosphorylase
MARAGRPDEALRWFEIALGMDLDDLTRTGAGGLHYATIGGAWQAFLLGFVGVTVDSNGLRVSPNLPQAWRRIRTRFTYSGVAVEIVAGHHQVVVTAEHPVPLYAPGVTARRQSRLTLSRDGGRWTES